MILLLITGAMGSGKTSVLAEASDILAAHEIPHATIGMDGLGGARLALTSDPDKVMYENLSSVSENYARLGLNRLLIARAVENRAELNRCCKAVTADKTLVCRLVANVDTPRKRVAAREYGILREELIRRVTVLTAILDSAGLEDFSISTENRSVTETAREMLIRAAWILE